MDTKTFLCQIKYSTTEIRLLRERIEELRTVAERATAALSGMPGGGKADGREATVVALVDCQRELAEDLRKQLRVERDVSAAIRAVEDPCLRTLLQLRYINGLQWAEVAGALGYELRHVHRLHAKALAAVVVPEQYR